MIKEKILQDLRLSDKRMKHTLGVVKAAVMLAERHFPEIAPEDAEIAALMHDYTKEYPVEKHLEICARYGVEVTEEEIASPKLLHAKSGAALAKEVYGLKPEIVSAVRWHTTGRPAMEPLEVVLYFADYIEENRTFPGCVRLRNYYEKEFTSRKDKQKSLYLALERSFELTMRDLLSEKKPIDGMTVEARNYYLKLTK